MEQLIDEEIMKNHNQADAFISLFFAGLDAVYYIVLLSLFGFNFKSWNSPKQKLFLLLVMDAVIRIIDMYTDEYSKYFFKEFFFTLISTLQFNIILSILSQIFTEKEADLEANSGIRNKSLMSAIFFGISFSFKGIFTNYKFISCIQYICSIIGIFMLSKYISSKIEIFMSNSSKKDPSSAKENFVNNMPFYISIYLIIRYFFEIFSLFIDNKLYASYIIMVCKIFKEVGKYLVILLLSIVYHAYHILTEGEYGYNQEKNKVDIYKDEEEYN